MPEDKKKFGRTKAAAVSKGQARNAAFKKQCQAYKKANPKDYAKNACKNMNFNNPVQMSDLEKAMFNKSKKGTVQLSEQGKKDANKTIRDAYNKTP